MMPQHLGYLKSYFGPNRMTLLLALSIAAEFLRLPLVCKPCDGCDRGQP